MAMKSSRAERRQNHLTFSKATLGRHAKCVIINAALNTYIRFIIIYDTIFRTEARVMVAKLTLTSTESPNVPISSHNWSSTSSTYDIAPNMVALRTQTAETRDVESVTDKQYRFPSVDQLKMFFWQAYFWKAFSDEILGFKNYIRIGCLRLFYF